MSEANEATAEQWRTVHDEWSLRVQPLYRGPGAGELRSWAQYAEDHGLPVHEPPSPEA